MAKSVLIVDDDEPFLSVFTEILKDEGFVVIAAQTGKAALEAISSVTPELVVTDLKMADMTGVELKNAISKDIPVILCSASLETKELATRENFAGYLLKPFNIKDLLESLENVIGSRRC